MQYAKSIIALNVDVGSIGDDVSPRCSRERLDTVVEDRLLIFSLQKMSGQVIRTYSPKPKSINQNQ